jgi:NAD(P)H-quinone oxidoreductase subunit 5
MQDIPFNHIILSSVAALPLLLLGSVALLPRVIAMKRPRAVAEWTARLAAAAAVTVTLLCILVGATEPVQHHFMELGVLQLGVRLDGLSLVIFLLIAFLAAVVTRYSVNYLAGDERQGRFAQGLALTAAASMMFVISSNLLQMGLAWFVTSMGLHKLLSFYRNRSEAVYAARLKFVFSRVADVSMLAGCWCVYQVFASLDLAVILAAASEAEGGLSGLGNLGVAALAFAAILKTAQFPFHTWLPESLEAPTPVSALMHAGVVNAGGFLLVRLAPLMLLSPMTLKTVALVGAVSALIGSLVLMTQTSIKKSLAWSTVAQMGFMMLQCGLGAFSLAVLHIVAHSLYKAYAFLSSGSVVQAAKSAWVPTGRLSAHPLRLAVVCLVAAGITAGLGWWAGVLQQPQPGTLVLVTIFVMALSMLLWNLWSARINALTALLGLGLAMMTGLLWFGMHFLAELFVGDGVPAVPAIHSTVELGILTLIALLFVAVVIFQLMMPVLASRSWVWRLQVHAENGFYVATLFRRLFYQRLVHGFN